VIASQIVGLCRGYAKHGSADIGVVIQGEDHSELPEKMLACVCFNKIDIDRLKRPLDCNRYFFLQFFLRCFFSF
jgi:hypothetical protein